MLGKILTFFLYALQFQIPELRVGTLNSLLTLGDELAKVRKSCLETLNLFLWIQRLYLSLGLSS